MRLEDTSIETIQYENIDKKLKNEKNHSNMQDSTKNSNSLIQVAQLIRVSS